MFVFQSIQSNARPVPRHQESLRKENINSNPIRQTPKPEGNATFFESEAKNEKRLVIVVEHRNKNIIIEPGLLKE